MDDEYRQRQALNEPEPPLGPRPMAIAHGIGRAKVTEASGQIVDWVIPIDTVADWAQAHGLTPMLPDDGEFLAVWA